MVSPEGLGPTTLGSETGPIERVLLRHARDAFRTPERIAEQWSELGYSSPPDFDAACREYDAFATLLESAGARIEWLPAAEGMGLDSIYARDAAVLTEHGAVLCRMGKPARAEEPAGHRAALERVGIRRVGEITAPGTLEGGDALWLAPDWLAVGRGYRTNRSGVEQLAELLGPEVRLTEVPLPHWNGPQDVFHLMSVISPLAPDLALVYARLLPIPFREALLEAGFRLVEVPDAEFTSQGCNVLALAPRVAVALEGNPETRRRMEAAGVEVLPYSGAEISLKGCGGPTCLTRPLERAHE